MSVCLHSHPLPDEALKIAESTSLSRGAAFTPLRRQVLSLLASSAKPLGAYDLIALIATETGRTPAPITIYRTLDFLLEQGFAHRIHAINAYMACSHGHERGETVFMVCEACGCVSETGAENVDVALEALAHSLGFKAKTKQIELFGTCGHCQ